MATIPDSSGLPTSGAGTGRRLTRADLQAMIDKSVTSSIGEAFRLSGQADERNATRLRDLEARMETLIKKVSESSSTIAEIKIGYDEYREWGSKVAEAVAATGGDARTLHRTMERVDGLVEIAQLLLRVLEPTSRAINWMIDRLHRLDRRTYSHKDGADITDLVNGPRRRASDRG